MNKSAVARQSATFGLNLWLLWFTRLLILVWQLNSNNIKPVNANQSTTARPLDNGIYKSDDGLFLAQFSARSLVRMFLMNNNDQDSELLEVEEIYDANRRLGKTSIEWPDGRRSELFVRASDSNLANYLEANYDQDGKLERCAQLAGIPSNHPFADLQAAFSIDLKSFGHLLGPAALVYRLRRELKDKWQPIASTKKNDPKNVVAELGQRQRISLDQSDSLRIHLDEKGQLMDTQSNQSEPWMRLVFKRSDYPPASYPLLSSLASYVSVTGPHRLLVTDILALNQVQLHGRDHRDPFRLPSVLSCTELDDHASDLNVNKLQDMALRIWPIEQNLVSFRLRGAHLPLGGTSVFMDVARGLVKVTKRKTGSSYLVKLSDKLLYHLENEQSIETTNHATRICSVVALSPLSIVTNNAFKYVNFQRGSARRLRFILGDVSLVSYLGRTRLDDSWQTVHEFEVRYPDADHLPIYLALAAPGKTFPASTEILARVYVAPCDDLDFHRSEAQCKQPEIVALAFETQEGRWWLQVSGFSWLIVDEGMTIDPMDAFDLHSCPIDSVRLSSDLTWPSTMDETQMPKDSPDINEFAFDYLKRHISKSMAVWNLMFTAMSSRNLPGHQSARFTLELTDTKTDALKFEFDGSGQQPFSSPILDQFPVDSSLDCLLISSKYMDSNWTVYGQESGNCFVLSGKPFAGSTEASKDLGNFKSYRRSIEPKPRRPNGSGLEILLADELPAMNRAIASDRLNLLSETVKLGDGKVGCAIGFSPLVVVDRGKKHRELNSLAEEVLSGWRFAKPESNKVASWAQCLARCNEDFRCDSFAHCESQQAIDSQFCQLNEVDDLLVSEVPAKVRDSNCAIYSKNYLASYFESEPLAVEPGSSWLQVNQNHHLDEPNSCAKLCFSLATCSMFAHCPASDGQPASCLVEQAAETWNSSWSLEPFDGSSQRLASCQSFNRKPISFFEHQLELQQGHWVSGSGEQVASVKLDRLSLGECASRCLESASCRSFDACISTQSEKLATGHQISAMQQQCRLIDGSTLDSEAGSRMSLVAVEQNTDERTSCQHYEPFDRSSRLSNRRAAQIAHSVGQRPTIEQRLSRAAALLCAALVGVCLGVGFNLLVSTLTLASERLVRRRRAL